MQTSMIAALLSTLRMQIRGWGRARTRVHAAARRSSETLCGKESPRDTVSFSLTCCNYKRARIAEKAWPAELANKQNEWNQNKGEEDGV